MKKKASTPKSGGAKAGAVSTPCLATDGPRGAIHAALMTGSYDTYRRGLTGGCYAEHGIATREQFIAAARAFQHIEMALLNVGPMPRHFREPLMRMGELAGHVASYDEQILSVVMWAEALLRVPIPALVGSCTNIRSLLAGTVRPEFARLDPEEMASMVQTSQGAYALVAALWNAAGIGGARKLSRAGAGRTSGGSATIDKDMVRAAANRARKIRMTQNDR